MWRKQWDIPHIKYIDYVFLQSSIFAFIKRYIFATCRKSTAESNLQGFICEEEAGESFKKYPTWLESNHFISSCVVHNGCDCQNSLSLSYYLPFSALLPYSDISYLIYGSVLLNSANLLHSSLSWLAISIDCSCLVLYFETLCHASMCYVSCPKSFVYKVE